MNCLINLLNQLIILDYKTTHIYKQNDYNILGELNINKDTEI